MPPFLLAIIAGGIFAYLMARAAKGSDTAAVGDGNVEPRAGLRSVETIRIAPVTINTAFPQTLSDEDQARFLRDLDGYHVSDQVDDVRPTLPLGVTVPKDGGSDAAILHPSVKAPGGSVPALGVLTAANRLGHILLVTPPQPDESRGVISLPAGTDYKPFIIPGSNWFLFLAPNSVDDVAARAGVSLPAARTSSSVATIDSYVAPTSAPSYALFKPEPPPSTAAEVVAIEEKSTTPADELPLPEFEAQAKVWSTAKSATSEEDKNAVIPDLVADSALLRAKGYDLASSQFLTQATTYGYIAAKDPS